MGHLRGPMLRFTTHTWPTRPRARSCYTGAAYYDAPGGRVGAQRVREISRCALAWLRCRARARSLRGMDLDNASEDEVVHTRQTKRVSRS